MSVASRIAIRLPVVRSPRLPEPDILRMLGSLNLTAVGAALVYRADAQLVECVSMLPATTAPEEIDRHQRLHRALMRHDAPLIAQLLRGESASDLRPAAYGPGADPRVVRKTAAADDAVLAAVAEAGGRRSPFLGADAFARLRALPGRRAQGGAAGGVSATIPFGEVSDDGREASASMSLNPLEDNRRIGSGLAVYAHLPGFLDEPTAARVAHALNLREIDGAHGERFAGAWCVTVFGSSFSVGYASFVPAAWFDPDVPTRLHDEMTERLERVAAGFAPRQNTQRSLR